MRRTGKWLNNDEMGVTKVRVRMSAEMAWLFGDELS